ncbi:MAG TPA: 50S ribosomal protein L4 [Myxococcota bacterium]|jgi:large subunit ribosomal protein L4
MATLDVVTAANRKAGSVDLEPSIFEAPVRPHLFHAEVRRQLAKRRAGTHSTKNRAAVSGGGIKPWKQKGTGRARQGTIRAPQWAGGGVVFGPVPRSYEHTLTKKVRKAALCGALSHQLREGNITVIDELGLSAYKTKQVAKVLQDLSLKDAPVLIVIAAEDPFVERSARNLPNVSVLRVAGLNVYDVLRHRKLLLTRAAVAAIAERLRSQRAEVAP